tara:strand:+ start:2151 stop:2627 length:477 start_codon:yes stop_codon:yes gene_type:complete
MATSLLEQIAQVVVTQLETVTTANGYDNQVSSVIRPRRTGENYRPVDKMVVLMQQSAEMDMENTAAGFPAGIGWKQLFAVDLILRQAETNTSPMDQLLNSFIADIQKAIMEDVQWGGLAIDTSLVSVDYPEPSGGFEGATVWFEISYRVKENDPYTRV